MRWRVGRDGFFVVPGNVTEVVVEVGARDLRDYHAWLDAGAHRMVVSFEPNRLLVRQGGLPVTESARAYTYHSLQQVQKHANFCR